MEETHHFWLLFIVYSVIFVFGILGNVLIMIFFGLKMKRHSSFRWFLIQLSIADCICCIVSPLLTFNILFNEGTWSFGSITCKAVTPIGPLTVNVSAWILCAISYERYRAVAHPHKPRLNKFQVNIICGIVWLGSIVLSIPYFLWAKVHNNLCQLLITPEQQLINGLVALLSQSIVPSSIMILAFLFIRKEFNKQKRSSMLKENGNNVEVSSAKSKAKVTTQTLSITCITFVICSLPYNILYVLGIVMFEFKLYSAEEQKKYGDAYDQCAFWFSLLVVSNSFMNCFIYAGKFPKFRKFIFHGLCCCCKRVRKQKAAKSQSQDDENRVSMITCTSLLAASPSPTMANEEHHLIAVPHHGSNMNKDDLM